jgi:hypothetical protein
VPDAIAVGYTAAEAQKFVPAVSPMWSRGQIMRHPCASITGDFAGWAWGRACDTQKFVQDNGGGNWIIGDQIVGSGNDPCCLFGTGNLEALDSWVVYGANNSIFDWSPNSTVPAGGCTNWTASLSYNGVGLSAQTTICSDQLDPKNANSGTSFGSRWTGCDSNAYVEGNASTDIDYNPSNASDVPTLWVGIGWGNC